MAAPDDMPDLSHLTEEERKIIQEVLQRQKAEENKEQVVQQQHEKELEDIERQINERKEIAMRNVGTQDDAICQICQKTKFADGIGHKCYYCQLRSCARCGGRTQVKVKDQRPSTAGIQNKGQQAQQKNVWACSLCQKRQQILAKTGKWFNKDGVPRATTPTNLSPTTTPTPPHHTPNSYSGEFRSGPLQQQQPNGQAGGRRESVGYTGATPVSGAKHTPSQRGGQQAPYMNSTNHQQSSQQPYPGPGSPHAGGDPQFMRQQSLQRQSSIERQTNAVDQSPRNYPMQNDRRTSSESSRSGQSYDRRSAATVDDRRYQDDQHSDHSYRSDRSKDASRRESRTAHNQGGPPVAPPLVDDRGGVGQPYAGDYATPAYVNNRERTTDARRRESSSVSKSPVQRRNGPSDRERDHAKRMSIDRSNLDQNASPYDIRPPSPKYLDDQNDARYSSNQQQQQQQQQGYYDDRTSTTIAAPPRDVYRNDQYDSDRGRNMDNRISTGSRDNLADNRGGYPNDPRRSASDYGYDRGQQQQRFDSDRESNSQRQFAGGPAESGRRESSTKHSGSYERDSAWSGSDREYDTRNKRVSNAGEFRNGDRNQPTVVPELFQSQQNVQDRGLGYPDDGGSMTPRRQPVVGVGAPTARRSDQYYDQSPSRSPVHNDSQYVERRRLPQIEDAYDRQYQPPTVASVGIGRRSQGVRGGRLDANAMSRGDSLSSDMSETLAKSSTSPHLASKHHHHHNKHITAATLRQQAARLRADFGRKQRSFSSSDEDVPSTSECQSCEDVDGGAVSDAGDIDKLNARVSSLTNAVSTNAAIVDANNAQLLTGTNQLPVTWQLNSDGSRMIGHMILRRHTTASLGLKVVGGRPTTSGRLGAFITRVKRGTIADIVGHLKPGDEVLEWNGRQLQNAMFDEVCEIINESKHDTQIELVVSRPTGNKGSHDLLALQNKALLMGSQVQILDPVNNLVQRLDAVSLQPQQISGAISLAYPAQMATMIPGQTPVVMITAPADLQSIAVQANAHLKQAKGQIFGKIEVALLYSPADEQLVVTTYQAMDLPPRSDGAARNPYVKLFLLPDRSEKSRRQSNVLADTCHPVWQQSFIYQRVTQVDLVLRVLEITLWDYDQFTTNDFLGEVLFDLATSLLDNEPRWYTLTDMDEESPVRLKLRQQRLSAYTNQGYQTFGSSGGLAYDYGGRSMRNRDNLRPHSTSGYRSDSGLADTPLISSIPRSHTYHRARHPDVVDPVEMDLYGGYYSDHGRGSRTTTRRLPKTSAMAPPLDLRPGSPTAALYDEGQSGTAGGRRHLPRIPPDLYGEEAMRELDDKVQQLRSHGYAAVRRHRSAHNPINAAGVGAGHHSGRRNSRLQQNSFDVTSPPADGALPGGYQSDGSETSMSVTSTQSERLRTRTAQEFQNSLEAAQEESETYNDAQDGTMSDSAMGNSMGPSGKSSAFSADAKRKKSLMTRLIPGRAGSAQTLNDQKKRLGFPRSEEVGIPAVGGANNNFCNVTAANVPVSSTVLSPLANSSRPPLLTQDNVESLGGVVVSCGEDRSSWMPIIPSEGCLGEFVPGLGPGQVVGRQALASPCMGEIQLVVIVKSSSVEIRVVRARNLMKKPGSKFNPAPYVKIYLMDGKQCLSKAKTGAAARTAEPRFDQHLVFAESTRNRFLQISVWGDYGRMERRTFMGIALIKLDNLEPSRTIEGWYKLYHSNSLVGTSSPARKDSEISMPDGGATMA